jgi:nitroreductase
MILHRTTTILMAGSFGVGICWRGAVWDVPNAYALALPTGKEVSTGIEMDLVTLQQLELSKIYCPHCRQPHHMAGIEYWLQIHQAEPQEESAEAA